MKSGKERLAHRREHTNSRFDQILIDDYTDGEPPDLFDRRAIRIVYGASRLNDANEPSMVLAAADSCMMSPNLPPRPRFEVAPVSTVGSRSSLLIDDPDSVLLPFRPADDDLTQRCGDQDVPRSISNVSEKVSEVNPTPPEAARKVGFNWAEFAAGLIAGGLAGAAVIVVIAAL